ncbi:MAG: hypothetical protein ABSH39_09200 [Candidatus Acidiferrum sp.]|jgi:hypothetical protein
MMCSKLTKRVLCTVLAFFCIAGLSAQSSKPITYKGLLDSLNTHGLSNAELAKIVKTRGVEFELTPAMESELKAAGADAELLTAVRASYRGAASSGSGGQTASPAPSGSGAGSGGTTATPPVEKRKDTPVAPANAPIITSIKDVKKLYIEKMPSDLDEFIKTEMSKQLPGRFVIVLRPEDADAIMKGNVADGRGTATITDIRGTAELWAGEAGDKGLYLTKVHGGEKKIAERLVGNLKKVLQ